MNYRTTCPECASVFLLGADQLDAAQGWVQCSVCGAAFDAYPSLLMEDGSPLPPPVEPTPIEAPAQAEAAPAESEPEETFAAEVAESIPAQASPETAAADEAGSEITPRGIAQREAPTDLPSIILIDPDIPVPEDLGPLPEIQAAPAYPAKRAVPVPAPAATPAARIEYATPMPGTVRIRVSPRRIKPWIWAAASTLLLLLLLAQISFFLRDALVSRMPQTRPAFEQACAVLGCTLSLPQNLALLQIVGSDLQTESSSRLKLTLTLGNRASHVQAWPVLVLTLNDQRNRPLARRSFAPSEYLGDSRRIADGIPPRSEQALSLPLSVRNLAPMGFDLQLTY
ncbi:MAG: DUF3426 domain-containing protein [Thiobacillus sp.]|nr:DUF3426 domain-containing protein [Thiobacillus sp.]